MLKEKALYDKRWKEILKRSLSKASALSWIFQLPEKLRQEE